MQKIMEKNYPQLVKGPATYKYKMVIPDKVEKIIKYLLNKFPHTEWSGVLFYSYSGSFEKGDLVITCEDILPMDLGNSTYTEFKMSPDVAGYIAQNIDLFDCNIGLVHSHHSMPTIFSEGNLGSGTDMNTLQSEGSEQNCFVSLIVNNAGNYAAAITRKRIIKSNVSIQYSENYYEFFGEGKISVNKNASPETRVVEKEIIEYFMLDINKSTIDNPLSYLDTRFDYIQEKKRANQTTFIPRERCFNESALQDSIDWGNYSYRSNVEYKKEPTLFSEEEMDSLKDIKISDYSPSNKDLYMWTVRMIGLGLNINPDKFNLKQWIDKHMDNIYTKVFPGTQVLKAEDQDFKDWATYITEFATSQNNPDFADVTDYDELENRISIFAEALIDTLDEYKENNSYIETYIDYLSTHL